MVIYPPCRKCGKSHGMGIEDMATGEIEPIDVCYECLWEGFKINPLSEDWEKQVKEFYENISK